MEDELKDSIEEVCKKYITKVSEALDNDGINRETVQDDIRVLLRIYNELSAPVGKPNQSAYENRYC